ncbi:YqiA/YcfP family alpha/beta fold hydrolase [Shewanella psychrotolerans]|uniref:YqiA/YcfP family alpha/beta fold hydrolase n=1 Tax=Shewanella psychrotolerans TaxID=2864206 RepID=UPI001C656813|nr:YqiA/YcfP family alpha/beta fold hydrolase [Shewanella psychrotolerans]QYK00977.1 esterase YqiA [Shewanella psychrotolerans]
MLLYIHGFNSSPQSEKGVITAEYIANHFPQLSFFQPQLPSAPKDAMALLIDIVERERAKGESLHFIGSSLGGYFASYLAETYGGKAVLINPAVTPFELFDEFLGPQYNPYTDETYEVLPAHKQEVALYNTEVIFYPERFFVLLQSGDEVLDYKQAVNKYHCCQLLVEAGGDHSFIGYEQQLDRICQFLFLDK